MGHPLQADHFEAPKVLVVGWLAERFERITILTADLEQQIRLLGKRIDGHLCHPSDASISSTSLILKPVLSINNR